MNVKKIYIIIFYFLFLLSSVAWCQSSKLGKLEREINSSIAIQDSIYHEIFLELKAIGFNDTLKNNERINALILIGKLKTPESINFLLDTISHAIFTGDYSGDIDIYRENPCFYGLFKYNRSDNGSNLFLFPFIMESLKRDEKDEHEIRLLSKLLKFAIPHTPVLIDYLEFRLRGGLPPQKENLKKIINTIKPN